MKKVTSVSFLLTSCRSQW